MTKFPFKMQCNLDKSFTHAAYKAAGSIMRNEYARGWNSCREHSLAFIHEALSAMQEYHKECEDDCDIPRAGASAWCMDQLRGMLREDESRIADRCIGCGEVNEHLGECPTQERNA